MDEPGGALVRRTYSDHAGMISRLSEVEVASALHRRHAARDISTSERDRALAEWELDMLQLHMIEFDRVVAGAARQLLASQPLRAGDAVQLATALTLQRELALPVTFVCFDARLAAAARREGLQVLPEVNP